MSKGVYFLSDAHIGAERGHQGAKREALKEKRLISFIRGLKGRAEVLYIVGDLFDFWFEYKTCVPKRGLKVLFELSSLIESGTRVVYVAGNHDLWGGSSTLFGAPCSLAQSPRVGTFLSDEIGIEFCPDSIDVRHQGLKIHIAHGDGLSKDTGYDVTKWILRNRACIGLFRLIHPDLGSLIAKSVSRTSRSSRTSSDWSDLKDNYIKAAQARLKDGTDVVVYGHVHIPVIEELKTGTLLVLGDWIRHFTYGVLKDGKMSLERAEGL